MKKAKILLIAMMVAGLLASTVVSSFYTSDEVERAADPSETRFTLFSWQGGAYYTASVFGSPFQGILFPGEPLIMDLPGLVHVEFVIVDTDEHQFTLEYIIIFGGTVLFEGVADYGHGLYSIYYNPFVQTPVKWDHDFSITWCNGPGFVHLWAVWPESGSWSHDEATASRESGVTDVSFAIPDWVFVDAFVSEFGKTTNTYDFTIEFPWTTYQGRQPLPFGYFTVAYLAQPYLVFQVAEQGCSMAHCDVSMSDNAKMRAPTGWDTQILWHDSIPAGSNQGLGCSSNGTLAVCTYKNPVESLVMYDARGARLWTSEDHLGDWAWASAAMIDDRGGVIAADATYVIRFLPDGNVKWKTEIPGGGLPISPVITSSGVVVVATRGGPIAAFDNVTGLVLGWIYLIDSPGDTEFYDTWNTPCVRGNRIYVSTEKRDDPSHTGRLWAVDIDPTDPDGTLRAAWSFVFGGPSGASPLVIGDTVYFDGDRLGPGEDINPHAFAVQDNGDTCSLRWKYAMPWSVKASFSRDPRGGIWAFAAGVRWLIHLDEETGQTLELLDVDELVDEEGVYVPSSIMTIAGDPSQPVMILGVAPATTGGPSWVIAVDLDSWSLLWKVKLADDWEANVTSSQFAIVEDDEGKAVVVFPARNSGAYGVGEP